MGYSDLYPEMKSEAEDASGINLAPELDAETSTPNLTGHTRTAATETTMADLVQALQQLSLHSTRG